MSICNPATYRDCPSLSTIELAVNGGQAPYTFEWFKLENCT